MMWQLFLDDERFPAMHETNKYVIARTVEQAVEMIRRMGMPTFISFDNDLGEGMLEGYDLAKKIVEMDLNGTYRIPDGFDWYVHSQNSVAVENIHGLLKNYLENR
jgi:hypothetical protein